MNAAGSLEESAKPAAAEETGPLAALREAGQRVAVQAIFWWTQVRILQ